MKTTTMEIVPASPALPPDIVRENLARLEEAAVQFANASMAANTRAAYLSDLRMFSHWCTQHGIVPVPTTPATVALYITALASDQKRRAATIQRRMSAISKWHSLGGHADPVDSEHVRRIWKGIRRTIGVAQVQKRALSREELHDSSRNARPDLMGLRDRAIMLFGFESAMRRSEIAAMEVSWLEFGSKGVLVTLPSSKTNQEGHLEQLVVDRRDDAFCPVTALETWLASASIQDGVVFRRFNSHREMMDGSISGAIVAHIVKTAMETIGISGDKYAGHSLRRGYVTTSNRDGKSMNEIMEVTRHATPTMVMRYIERDNLRQKIGSSMEIVLKSIEEVVRKSYEINKNGCWIWNGAINQAGYGYLTTKGCTRLAHRASYEIFVGPIGDGLVLDHLCSVRRCINPAHLEAVSLAENTHRIRRASVTQADPRRPSVVFEILGIRQLPSGE